MLCKEQVAQLRDRIGDIHSRGAELVVIGNGTPEQARWFVEDQGLDLPVFTDPERVTYRALGARRGLRDVLHPGTFLRSLRAFLAGERQTARMGDATQLGGVVVVRPDGSMPFREMSRHPGDHPEPREIVNAIDEG